MRFSSIMVTYFLIGAILWGAGFVSYGDAGPVEVFVNDPIAGVVEDSIVSDLESMGGPISNVVGTLGGGLLAVWGFLTNFLDLVFWPYTTLHANGAPPRVSLVLGGGVVAAFVGAIIRTVRGTA